MNLNRVIVTGQNSVLPPMPFLQGKDVKANWNATALAYLGDSVWEVRSFGTVHVVSNLSGSLALLTLRCSVIVQLYVRRHFFFPPSRLMAYYDGVTSQVRAETQVLSVTGRTINPDCRLLHVGACIIRQCVHVSLSVYIAPETSSPSIIEIFSWYVSRRHTMSCCCRETSSLQTNGTSSDGDGMRRSMSHHDSKPMASMQRLTSMQQLWNAWYVPCTLFIGRRLFHHLLT
jgi:23S rRNA maturation mini-RNase III